MDLQQILNRILSAGFFVAALILFFFDGRYLSRVVVAFASFGVSITFLEILKHKNNSPGGKILALY